MSALSRVALARDNLDVSIRDASDSLGLETASAPVPRVQNIRVPSQRACRSEISPHRHYAPAACDDAAFPRSRAVRGECLLALAKRIPGEVPALMGVQGGRRIGRSELPPMKVRDPRTRDLPPGASLTYARHALSLRVFPRARQFVAGSAPGVGGCSSFLKYK